MKILVVCQYYYPEPFRISDICEALVKRGHEVTVITGTPNYPMGRIYQGYRHGQKKDEILGGVKVHRCFTIGRRGGILRRVLNYYSFAFSSACYARRLKEQYDVVFVNQLSPVMMAQAGVAYKKKNKVPLVLYCLDLWPESVVVGGMKRGGLVYKWFLRVSRRIYRSADTILTTSKSFAEYFKKTFDIDCTRYMPQYAEDFFEPEKCKKQRDEFVDLMFAGNLGAAQGVDTIVQAARLTKEIECLRWHIVGEGSEYERLKKAAADLPQVFFYGRLPVEQMPGLYAKADAMLVTMQSDPIISLTLPGKVQSYMAAGKPIIGAIDGETALVIQEAGCGICGPAQDAQALVQNVKWFMGEDHARLGENARQYSQRNYTKEAYIENLLQALSAFGEGKT